MKPLTQNQRDYLNLQATKSDEELQEIIRRKRREGNAWAFAIGVFLIVAAIAFLRMTGG